MAVQVNPITQSLPATTAIQDPAVRRFAQAVDDALRALRSEEGAVESLKKAADAMNGAIAGGTPPSIAQWLFSSELYQKLTTEIARVDTQAKQDVLDEALARSQAIQEIQAALAEIESTPAYDPATTYQIGDLVTYDNKRYRAKAETTGNLPTNTTYWDKVGDYATLGDVVAAHTLEINDLESRVTADEGNLTAEIANRQALATQVRGSYTGTDVNLVSQGLIYSERVARSTADSTETAKRESLSAKILGTTNPDGLTLSTLSEGLIFDERQARVSGDGANASSISALRAQVGVTEAGALTTGLILDEKNVRASNDLAIVSAVNTALAQITGVSTSISQSGQNLIANWTTAQANKWNQIESEVLTSGGQTIRAALLQESRTRANADGSLGAQWTLKTDINGYISGFGFASTANNAAPTSEFIIRADKFAVVMPGYGEHVPFAIGPSGADFLGNVTGTVNGASASTLVSTANTALTNANAAQTAANTANAALADIAADNKLTPVEKQSAANEWGIINRERASIQSQADALGILQERWDYDYVYAVLNDYITPLLQDISSTSVIDGATFRDKWSFFYEYRQRLINKMAAVAATKADWSNVTGSGKPENGATVGANSSNLKSGPGVNMVFNGDYTDGLAGTTVGWRSGGNQHSLGWNLTNYFVQGEGTAYITQPGTPGAGVLFDANIWNGQQGQHFAVTPGKKYEISAWLNCHRCEGRVILVFLDAAGAYAGEVATSLVSYGSGITSIGDMVQSWTISTAPSNAVKAYLIIRGYNDGRESPYVFFSRVYFGEAGAGQTEPSLWTPGRGISQITSSNVTTYIANAAIGNAQIGGNLWSTNWSGWGGSGWLLDRSGNFYGNNIYARGDIEASSLKANAAMVDSLHLKGSAVIIPLQVSYSAKTINLPYAQGVWHSADAFQYTLSLSGGGLFKFSFSGTFVINHWTGHANYGSGSLTKVVRIYLNGALVETVLTNLPNGASSFLSGTIPDKYYWLGPGNQTITIRMEALMADGGARVYCSGGSVSIQSFQTGASNV